MSSSDLRKLVASSLTTDNLEENVLEECDLDRVMAIGVAGLKDPLGSSLWRLKYANDHREYQPAKALLGKRSMAASGRRRVEPRSVSARLCECVLNEWLDEICRTCWGRGHIVVEGTPHARAPCSTCGGTGSRKPSETWRQTFMGLSRESYARWEPRFAAIYSIILAADDRARLEVAQQLGRLRVRVAEQMAA